MTKKSKLVAQHNQGFITAPFTPDPGYYPNQFPVKAGYWSDVDALTIYSAALLMFGIDPSDFQQESRMLRDMGESIDPDEMPIGYSDRLSIMKVAVNCGVLKLSSTRYAESGDIDYAKSYIKKTDLIAWCKSKKYDLPEVIFAGHNSEKKPENISLTEREKLHKIIIGMATYKYAYDPKKERNAATGENTGSIFADLERAGVHVDADTIRAHINQAAKFLPK